MTKPEITDQEWARLMALRSELFAAIKAALEDDGHCKSYEGHFAIERSLPNYFETPAAEIAQETHPWTVRLNCYLIGPHRHYIWSGDTFDECLTKAETDVRAWIKGDDSVRHFEP